jgi:hypothetical protein
MIPAIANIIATYVIYRFATLALRRLTDALLEVNTTLLARTVVKLVEFAFVAVASAYGIYNVVILVKAINAAAINTPSF